MVYKPPASVKATRAVTINKVAYAKDEVLSAAQVKAIPNLGALLSKGVLKPNIDPHARKQTKRPTPTNIGPQALKKLS
jgi:hypothetical protein